MQEIKDKKIKMRPSCFFGAKKICLESLLAAFVVIGALALNFLWYFFKRTSPIEFLSFGWKGVERFFLYLPYGYIILLIGIVLMASFAVSRFDLSRGIKMNSNMAILACVAVIFFLSSIFLVSGIEDSMKLWGKNRIPKKGVVSGRVMKLSEGGVVIKGSSNANRELLFKEKDDAFAKSRECQEGKMLQAMGKEDEGESQDFYVEEVLCH